MKKYSTGPKTDRPSGFTLIEVVVVLAMMSLMAGLGAVYFAGNVGSSRISKSARDISGTIKYGRLLAAETGQIQTVVFDLEAHSYGLDGRAPMAFPDDISVRVEDRLQGEMTRGKHFIRLLPCGGVQGESVVLQKGQSIVTILPDPIIGATVVKK
jgi:type II secretion system protein H